MAPYERPRAVYVLIALRYRTKASFFGNYDGQVSGQELFHTVSVIRAL